MLSFKAFVLKLSRASSCDVVLGAVSESIVENLSLRLYLSNFIPNLRLDKIRLFKVSAAKLRILSPGKALDDLCRFGSRCATNEHELLCALVDDGHLQ
jgi:hypothetical protein